MSRIVSHTTFMVLPVNGNMWCSTDRGIEVYSARTLDLVTAFSVPSTSFLTSLIIVGDMVWGGSHKGNITIWNIGSPQTISSEWRAHESKINTLSKNGGLVWSASDDGDICVWNAQTLERVHRIDKAHTSKIYVLLFEYDVAISCSWDMSIKIWDSKTFTEIKRIEQAHSDAITSMVIQKSTRDQVWIWTGSKDLCVGVWLLQVEK